MQAAWLRMLRLLSAWLGAGRRKPGPAAAALVLLLALGGWGLRSAMALNSWTINQTFMNSTASGWTLLGTAQLTAPGIDSNGAGWLRLTGTTSSARGAAWHSTAMPVAGGLYIAFDWTAWGGSGADGMALVLFDGTQSNPSMGAAGRGLGAAMDNVCTAGFTSSYLSVGLDAWGGYADQATACPLSGLSGAFPNRVGVRGAGTGTSGYPYITSAALSPSVGVGARPTSTSDGNFRRLHVSLTPDTSNWWLTVQVDVGSTRTTLIDRQSVPAPAFSTLRVALTAATGADTGGATNNHEVRNFVAAPGSYIAGRVFEDPNYGGGAGRSWATATGAVARPNARVELFTAAGSLLASTTTDSNGAYQFLVAANTSYQVRVVNSSVSSSRTGYTSSLRPVQTFRTDGSGTTAANVTDRVGGETPALPDADNASSTLAAITTGSAVPQSVASVTVPPLGIDNVDFGFNFSTVVNTNDTGQGSLRQAITNANTLTGDASLAVSGRTAAVEHIVFMLPNGTTGSGGSLSLTGGLRSSLNAFTTAAGSYNVATIAPASALPTISTNCQVNVIKSRSCHGVTIYFNWCFNNPSGDLYQYGIIALSSSTFSFTVGG